MNQILEYWIVNADKKVIEQYILNGEHYKLHEKISHGTIQCTVLEGLKIELNSIFG